MFLEYSTNIHLPGRKFLHSAKKSATGALKTTSKRANQKTAEATGDLISNKITDKITCASKTGTNSQAEDLIPREGFISPETRQKLLMSLNCFNIQIKWKMKQ